ncbi:hypothetical protein [Spiroplasma attinicola]|uniref:hypothetical protein n=1 Tax=Spiroplasma attinicola TaxID=2904537 RepID=UPI002022B2EE|nr:hypothetical protein [Spiroplasma sp. JKS002670]MCL8209554.1 hypothetical protein [Spiroplasma sp. JKS002670]
MSNIDIKDKCLAISIDIRNSTHFHEKYGIKKAAEIIANFMSECSVEMNKDNKFFSNIIYAGDGIIGICYGDDNEKAFDKMFKISLNLKQVILKYKEYFNAGIGIDYGLTAIVKVENLRKDKNNTLYTGNSVATASKLCKVMPFKHIYQNEKSYIGISKDFYQELSSENQKKFRETATKFIDRV